ncbi:MAG: hypothetical protein IIC78_07640 [Chloroflexi bacterium]|nr:hypothetical protein [Chloroflexota bacterium]
MRIAGQGEHASFTVIIAPWLSLFRDSHAPTITKMRTVLRCAAESRLPDTGDPLPTGVRGRIWKHSVRRNDEG